MARSCEIVVIDGSARAISPETSSSSASTVHEGSGASVTDNCFVLDLESYAGRAAGPGRYVRRVRFKSLRVYLRKSRPKVRMGIFPHKSDEAVEVSRPVAVEGGEGGSPCTFKFPGKAWLDPGSRYEFRILEEGGEGYAQGLVMYFDNAFEAGDFMAGCNGVYSSRSGCFKGGAEMELETSESVDLALKSDLDRKLDTSSAVRIASGLSEAGAAADAKRVGDALSALSAVSGLAALEAVSDAWKRGTAYKTGQIVRKDSALYCCLEDHAGIWMPDKWTRCTLDSIVGAIMKAVAEMLASR